MSPSLTTAWRSSSSCTSEPKLRSNGVLRKRSYDSCQDELAHTSAASAATSITIPPAASTWVKRSAGRTKARGTNRSESFHVGRTAGTLPLTGRGSLTAGPTRRCSGSGRRFRTPSPT